VIPDPQAYFVYNEHAKEFQKVDGIPVVVEGITGDFFLHQGLYSALTLWTVTEAKTGGWVYQNPDPETALAGATLRLVKCGQERLEEQIGKTILKYGLSPRHTPD
jgi:hypothetical protein